MRITNDFPPTLEAWYEHVETLTKYDILNKYQNYSFFEWYQQYKDEFCKKYTLFSNMHDSIPLSDAEIRSKFANVNLTADTMIYWQCTVHPRSTHVSSLYYIVFLKKTACDYCLTEQFFKSDHIVPFDRPYDYIANSTYCDNQDLKTLILLHKPVIKGLYAHEVAMLAYVSIGRFSTTLKFPSLWNYQWQVRYPEGLFYSLVSRGYIKECNAEDFLDFCNIKDLRFLLEAKNIKPGVKKSDVINKAKSVYFGHDAIQVLGFNYYCLSDKGLAILEEFPKDDIHNNIINPLLHSWLLPSGVSQDVIEKCRRVAEEREKFSRLKTLETSDFLLQISPTTYKGKLFWSSYEPIIEVNLKDEHEFDDDVNLKVIFGNITTTFSRIKSIYLLSNIHKLIVCKEYGSNKIKYICYELDTLSKCFEEKIPTCELINAINSPYRLLKETFIDSDTGIVCKEHINYFVSPADEITELLLNTYFEDKCNVSKLESILSGDISANYCVTVQKTDKETNRFIMHLMLEKKLLPPRFMKVELYKLLFILFSKSEHRTAQIIMDNKTHACEEIFEISKTLLSGFDDNLDKLCERINAMFPGRTLQIDPFSMYTGTKDDNKRFAYEHANKYIAMYNDIVLELKEKGAIPTRWLSEFSLYLLVKSYFSDAKYQYHTNWLGLQSLDIFIPSLNLAIEYQGIQHFQPIKVFGGDKNFQKTIERDERKQELCRLNNVKLLYWNYDETIDDKSLKLKLEELGVDLQNKKTFPEIKFDSISQKTTPKPKRQSLYIYQYDKEFNLIATFSSIKNAADSVGISNSSIAKAIHGERFLAGGFFWYRGEKPLKETPKTWIEFSDSKYFNKT